MLGSVPSVVRLSLQQMGICGTKVMRWEREWEAPAKPFLPTSSYNSDSMTTVATHDSETVCTKNVHTYAHIIPPHINTTQSHALTIDQCMLQLEQWWTQQGEDVREYRRYKGWPEEEEEETSRSAGGAPTATPAPAAAAAGGARLPIARRRMILHDSHRSPSLFHINPLGEYLALVPSLVHDDARLERVNVPGTVSAANWAYRMRPTLEQLAADTHLPPLLRKMVH